MADFKIAFGITMGHEGGFANDPVDVGGMTYRGIARRYHPSWEGWVTIDAALANKVNPDSKQVFDMLAPLVEKFYKANFWDVMLLDQVQSQEIANEMFDTGVNMDTTRAASFLQRSLNCMNRDGSTYPDLVEDGKMGPTSLDTLNNRLPKADLSLLLVWLNVCQGQHYMEYMKKSTKQEKFARSWGSRVMIVKKGVPAP
jgi:lysozyme family protein